MNKLAMIVQIKLDQTGSSKLYFLHCLLLSERDGPLVDRPLPMLRTRVQLQAIYYEKIFGSSNNVDIYHCRNSPIESRFH